MHRFIDLPCHLEYQKSQNSNSFHQASAFWLLHLRPSVICSNSDYTKPINTRIYAYAFAQHNVDPALVAYDDSNANL